MPDLVIWTNLSLTKELLETLELSHDQGSVGPWAEPRKGDQPLQNVLDRNFTYQARLT